MYEAFFELTEKPFSIQPDPSSLYWSRSHSLAYAMIEYGVLSRAGFTVITGEIGAGKTTLIRHLLDQLGDDVTVGLVSNAAENRGELLQWVLMAFGQKYDSKDYVALHSQFTDFLIAEYAAGRRTVLIVDEAQNLGPGTLEELRMLSNINADKDQLLQMILSGQPQLRDMLNRPDLIQFAQRVSADFHLRTLDEAEVYQYISFRMKKAGAKKRHFSKRACKLIAKATGGTPRLINTLCDMALVYAFSANRKTVQEKLVEDVIRDKFENGIFRLPMAAEALKDIQNRAAQLQDRSEMATDDLADAEDPVDIHMPDDNIYNLK